MNVKVSARDVTHAGLWLALYVLLALYPLLWIAAVPGGGTFRVGLAAALGFLALSTMAMQFVLTARFQWLAPPFGTDLVYAFHRYVTIVSLAFVVLHPVVLFGRNLPSLRGWLVPGAAPAAIGAGVLSLYALVIVAVTSFARRRLRLPYDAWRRLHGVTAAAAVLLGLWHALAAGRLLAGPVVRWLWIAWILGWVGLLLRVRLAKPLALVRRPWIVREVRRERGDVATLVVDPDGHDGFRFRAGQFAWLTWAGSPFAMAEHPFSFSGSAQRTPRIEFAIKASGDHTRRLVDTARTGDRVFVDGPFGTLSIDQFPDADGYVFVAGGAGIAPCISMLRTLADRGDRRPHLLLYGTSDWERTPFREELERLPERLNVRVVHVLERPPPVWPGERGYVSEAILARHLPLNRRYAYFVCGPPAMMDAVERALAHLGIPLADVHSERFDLV
jgi:predicted ferric reductase